MSINRILLQNIVNKIGETGYKKQAGNSQRGFDYRRCLGGFYILTLYTGCILFFFIFVEAHRVFIRERSWSDEFFYITFGKNLFFQQGFCQNIQFFSFLFQ